MTKNIKRPKFNFTWFYLVAGAMLLFFYLTGDGSNDVVKEAKYSELTDYISKGYVNEVIQTSETREKLLRALRVLKTKQVEAPKKKHGNIPL